MYRDGQLRDISEVSEMGATIIQQFRHLGPFTHPLSSSPSVDHGSSTIVRLSGLLQKVSNDDTWPRWCIILRKRAGIDKMDYHMFQRKYLLGCSGKLGEVLKQQ